MAGNDTTNPYVSPGAGSEAGADSAGSYRDRGLGLILFGSFQLLIAGFCALMVPLMAFAMTMSQLGKTQSNLRGMIPAVLTYAVLAAVLATLGVGSILARRWARALTLVFSWLWLVMGMLGMAFFIFFMGAMFEGMAPAQRPPASALLLIRIITGGVLGCVYLVLPGAFVLFYRSPHVKATCERRNPSECWTDRCPLPVLGVSVVLALTAFWLLCVPFYAIAIPAFGTILQGVPGGLTCLGVFMAAAWLARTTYQLRPGAWWGCVSLVLVLGCSAVVTFLRVDLMTFYEAAGLSPEELDMIRRMQIVQTMPMAAISAASAAVALGYLLWVRRYFFGGAHSQAGGPQGEGPNDFRHS